MTDKNKYELQIEQTVKFLRKSADNKLQQFVDGTIQDIFEKTILVMDEETDTYEVSPSDVEVIINRRCEGCGEEFNESELKMAINDGIGHHLEEIPCCPFCKSEVINEI